MKLKLLRKDFLPVGEIFNKSYTGREFESIAAYVISNGVEEFWLNQEDVLEQGFDLSNVPDYTHSKYDIKTHVIKIYHHLLLLDKDIDNIIKKIKSYTSNKFIISYIHSYKNIWLERFAR